MKRVWYLSIAAAALAAPSGCSSNSWCSRGASCAPCAPYASGPAMPAAGTYMTTPAIGVTNGTIVPGPDSYTPTTTSP